MIASARTLALILPLAVFLAAPARGAEDVTLLKDLTAVIMLLGLPCGQVVSAKKQTETDHIALCQNGNRYRLFVNQAARVEAQKL